MLPSQLNQGSLFGSTFEWQKAQFDEENGGLTSWGCVPGCCTSVGTVWDAKAATTNKEAASAGASVERRMRKDLLEVGSRKMLTINRTPLPWDGEGRELLALLAHESGPPTRDARSPDPRSNSLALHSGGTQASSAPRRR